MRDFISSVCRYVVIVVFESVKGNRPISYGKYR